MSTAPAPLTWRYNVQYKDGSIYTQPADDRSIKHKGDDEWWPSAFRDIDIENVHSFAMVKRGAGDTFVVDITNGNFYMNGTIVTLHDQDHQLDNFKLVYFREVKTDFVDGVPQDPEITKYYFGYEARDRVTGKKVKRLVGLNP